MRVANACSTGVTNSECYARVSLTFYNIFPEIRLASFLAFKLIADKNLPVKIRNKNIIYKFYKTLSSLISISLSRKLFETDQIPDEISHLRTLALPSKTREGVRKKKKGKISGKGNDSAKGGAKEKRERRGGGGGMQITENGERSIR